MAGFGRDDEIDTVPLLRPLPSNFTFGSAKLTLRQFGEDYANLLPLLVYVKEGFCSCNEKDFTVSSGEIYRVTHLLRQRRVVVKDTSGQRLSFPANHSLKFMILKKGQKFKVPMQPKTLEEILDSIYYKDHRKQTYISPVRKGKQEGEQLVFWNGADEEVTMEMDNLLIVDTYDEKYLVGNGVLDDCVALTPVILPLWLPVKVKVITGFEGEPVRKYQAFVEQLDYDLKDLKNYTTRGNEEIMLFEDDDCTKTYMDIRQSHYVTIGEIKRENPHTYERVNISREDEGEPTTSQITLGDDSQHGSPDKTASTLPAKRSFSRKLSKNPVDGSKIKGIIDGLTRKLSLHGTTQNKPNVPASRPNETVRTEEDISYQKIVKKNRRVDAYEVIHQEQPPEVPARTHTSASSIRRPPPCLPQEGSNGGKTSEYRWHSDQANRPTLRPSQNTRQELQEAGSTPCSTHRPTSGTRSEDSGLVVIQDTVVSEEKPSYTSRRSGIRERGVDPSVSPGNTPTDSDSGHWLQSGASTRRGSGSKDEHRGASCSQASEPLYATHSDVKVPIKRMSVDEVSGILVLLKLDKHVEKFLKKDVDGELLMALDKTILKEEFDFSNFEAIKLQRFIEGWRLNTAK